MKGILMNISSAIESLKAWLSGLFTTKEPVMADETNASTTDIETVAAAPAVEAPTTAVNTDTLKSILSALGHDLEAVWDDAIALAKKAL
jgi:hypothetical protein